MKEERLTSTLKRRSAGILLLRAAGIALAYGLQILLARWIGASEYGLFSYVLAWASTVALVAGLGFPAAALRFVPAFSAGEDWSKLRGFLRESTRTGLGVSVSLAMAATLAVVLLDHWMGVERVWLILTGVWSVPLLTMQKLQTETLRAINRLGWAYAPSLIARPLLIVVGGLILIKLGFALDATWVLVLSAGALATLLVIHSGAVRALVPVQTWSARPLVERRIWLRTAIPLLTIAFFLFIVGQADLLMLGFLADTDSVGFYRAASRTAAFVVMALMAVETVTAPMISSIYSSSGVGGLQRLVATSAHYIFWPSLAMTFAFFAFAEPVLGFFGPEFKQAELPLKILAVGHLVNAATGPAGYILGLTGHHDDSARVFGVAAAANIILNAILIPPFGMVGAAAATALTMGVGHIWLYGLVVTRLGVHSSIFSAARIRRS
jgi:O-antigen/teichoic acid export membrane protein